MKYIVETTDYLEAARLFSDLDDHLAEWEHDNFLNRVLRIYPGLAATANKTEVIKKLYEDNCRELLLAKKQAVFQLSRDWVNVESSCEKLIPIEWPTPVNCRLTILPINFAIQDDNRLKIYIYYKTVRFARPILHELIHVGLVGYAARNNIFTSGGAKDKLIELATDYLLRDADDELAQEARVGYELISRADPRIAREWKLAEGLAGKIAAIQPLIR